MAFSFLLLLLDYGIIFYMDFLECSKDDQTLDKSPEIDASRATTPYCSTQNFKKSWLKIGLSSIANELRVPICSQDKP